MIKMTGQEKQESVALQHPSISGATPVPIPSTPKSSKTPLDMSKYKSRRVSTARTSLFSEKPEEEGGGGDMVIYRNLKYLGLVYRSFVYLQTYVHFTLIQPWIQPIIKNSQDWLAQLLGLVYLLFFTPIHFFIALGLLITRLVKLYLVKKYYPSAPLCQNQSRSHFVTSVFWLKGKIDVQKLSSHFHFLSSSPSSSSSHFLKSNSENLQQQQQQQSKLKLKLCSRFGLSLFLPLEEEREFNIQNHIEVAPSELLKYFVLDGDCDSQQGKSTIEKFISKCASECPGVSKKSRVRNDTELSPWKITIIPIYKFNKQASCIVLTFHQDLLRDPTISILFDSVFSQCVYPEDEDLIAISSSNNNRPSENNSGSNNNYNNNLILFSSPFLRHLYNNNSNYKKSRKCFSGQTLLCCDDNDKQTDDEIIYTNEFSEPQHELCFQDPALIIGAYLVRKWEQFRCWCYSNLYVTSSDMKTWLSLQKKQFEFHGKSLTLYLFNSVSCELTVFVKKLVQLGKFSGQSIQDQWREFKPIFKLIVMVFRAVVFIPVEILSTTLFSSPSDCSGFERTKRKETRRVAWSSPIDLNLIQNIKEKTGASTSSIILSACSMALKDYYDQTKLPNPGDLE